MTTNENESVFEQVLHNKALLFMEECEERNPQLETMSLDEFLCEYRELLTERERERGNLILEAFSLVDYVESSIDVEQVYL
jgi:hypothetical protein|tara:strand:- start:2504 stop:2746 length:243 start_codon:yes stop_codon:yes gene_type:complete